MNMNAILKNLIGKLAGRKETAVIAPVTRKSFATAWLTGREDTLSGHSMLLNAYTQSSWVYACVSTLGDTVSAIPFRFVSADNSEVGVSKSELEKLFAQPHPQLDRFQFWELIVIWLCLRGEAFVYPVHSSRLTVPSSMLILNPDHLHEIVQHNELAGWRYTNPASNTQHPGSSVFLPEDLIHLRLPNPYNFWRGLSPLTIAWLAAQSDFAAAQFMKGMMLNNADTGLIVTTDQQVSPEQKEVIIAALRDRKRRAGTPDIPLFLFGGAKVDKPSISAVDLQFLENRKFNRQEICAIFKVPQELLGFTEDANRSVSESARLNFMENRIAPLCRRLEAAFQPLISRMVGTDRRAIRGEFHIQGTPIMQAAQRARIDCGEKLFRMGVPLNVVNRNLELGLPKLPHGDIGYLPGTLQPVGTEGSPKAQGERPKAEG